jgi:hypothetical protein
MAGSASRGGEGPAPANPQVFFWDGLLASYSNAQLMHKPFVQIFVSS